MYFLTSCLILPLITSGLWSSVVAQTSSNASSSASSSASNSMSTSTATPRTHTIIKTVEVLSGTAVPSQAVPKGPLGQTLSCAQAPQDSSGKNISLSAGSYPSGTFQPRNAWPLLNVFCDNTSFFQIQDPNYGFYAIGPGNNDTGAVVQLNGNYSLNRTNGNDYTSDNFNRLCFIALSTIFFNCSLNASNANISTWLDFPMVGGTYTAGDVEFDLFSNNNSIIPPTDVPRGGYAALPRPENNLGLAQPITSGTLTISNTFLATFDYVVTEPITLTSSGSTFTTSTVTTVPSQAANVVYQTDVSLSSEAFLLDIIPPSSSLTSASRR